MNNWIPKNKIIKLAVVIALFNIILYFTGLFVVFNEVKKIENFYTSTESEIYKNKKFLVLKSIAEKNSSLVQTLRDFFIQKGDEVKFIKKIEELARTSNVKFDIASLDIKPNQEGSFKEDIYVKMKVEGSWKSIINLLDKLNKISFGVSIEKIDLGTDKSGSWSGTINFIVFREK